MNIAISVWWCSHALQVFPQAPGQLQVSAVLILCCLLSCTNRQLGQLSCNKYVSVLFTDVRQNPSFQGTGFVYVLFLKCIVFTPIPLRLTVWDSVEILIQLSQFLMKRLVQPLYLWNTKLDCLLEENSRPGSVLKHDYSNVSEAHYLPGCQQILQPSLQVFAQRNTTWMSLLKI